MGQGDQVRRHQVTVTGRPLSEVPPASTSVDHQVALVRPVAQRHKILRRGDLVADALPGDLTLELGEGEKDIEGQSS